MLTQIFVNISINRLQWVKHEFVKKKIASFSTALIQYKMPSYQYRKSYCGDKTILRPSYLHNGISLLVLNQGLGNPIVEIRRSYDRLISTMGFPILIRWHLYIESGLRILRNSHRLERYLMLLHLRSLGDLPVGQGTDELDDLAALVEDADKRLGCLLLVWHNFTQQIADTRRHWLKRQETTPDVTGCNGKNQHQMSLVLKVRTNTRCH